MVKTGTQHMDGHDRGCAGKAPPVIRRDGNFLMMVSISRRSLVRAIEDDKIRIWTRGQRGTIRGFVDDYDDTDPTDLIP